MTPKALCLSAALWFVSSSAWAHPTPSSVAWVDFTPVGVVLEHDSPVEELERAMHEVLIDRENLSTERMLIEHRAELRDYLTEHVHVQSLVSKRAWSVGKPSVDAYVAEDGPRVKFKIEIDAPPGEASSSILLFDDIVSHEVMSHHTTLMARRDWAAGLVSDEARLVGTIVAGHPKITLNRAGSFWNGLWSMCRLGMTHISTGTDHLLFLTMLLLAAPMVSQRQRWTSTRPSWDTMGRLVRIVSAFTVGHSLTLAAQTMGFVAGTASWIEPMIAGSILVTSVHAAWPLWGGAETWLAGGFGLIHGLAFASALTGRELGRSQTGWALFGFNCGIEIAQLCWLTLLAPWCLLLARTPWYQWFRPGCASIGGVFALGWLVERVGQRSNPFEPWIEQIEKHPLVGLAVLALLSIFATVSNTQTARVFLNRRAS